MATGYFAGLYAILYRETTDGRRVTSRRLAPFLPTRWALVPPESKARFERRTKRAHIGFLVGLAIAVQFIPDEPSAEVLIVGALIVGLVAAPLMKAWATAGLPAYDGDDSSLLPANYLEQQERQARAMGTRWTAGFLVLSLILAVPQLFVALTDGHWWAWLGFTMFAGSAFIFGRSLSRL